MINKPRIETVLIVGLGSIGMRHLELSDVIDKSFKPGLYKQVEGFMNDNFTDFCTISDQQEMMKIYNKISNYNV